MRTLTHPGLAIAFVLSLTIFFGGKKITYQIYDCPMCDRDGQMFAEDSAKIHKCSGTAEKPHSSVVLVHKGKTVIEVK